MSGSVIFVVGNNMNVFTVGVQHAWCQFHFFPLHIPLVAPEVLLCDDGAMKSEKTEITRYAKVSGCSLLRDCTQVTFDAPVAWTSGTGGIKQLKVTVKNTTLGATNLAKVRQKYQSSKLPYSRMLHPSPCTPIQNTSLVVFRA